MPRTRLQRLGLPEPVSPVAAAEAALRRTPLRDATRLAMRLDAAWSQDPGIPKLLAAVLHQATEGRAGVSFALVATALWCAADVADDLMDGDVAQEALGEAHLDGIRLQALAAWACRELPEGPERVHELLQRMCAGQALDLAGRESIYKVDVDAIVAGKAGAEVGGLAGLAARVAGVQAGPWEAAGHHLGAVLQRVSDLADLIVDGPSDDWRAAHPSSALRLALRDDPEGWVRRGLAGDRALTEAPVRTWMRAQPGLRSQILRGIRVHLAGLREAAGAAAPAGALDPLLAAGTLAADQGEALWPPPAPRLAELAQFLADNAGHGDDVEVHRWGLFGPSPVRGDLFGPLVVLLAAGPRLDGRTRARLRTHAWDRRTVQGAHPTWRFYPGHLDIPEDADDLGLALQVFGTEVDSGAPERLARAFAPQGFVHTWLSETSLTWNPAPCPVVTANAWAGLDAVGSSPPDPDATAESLATWAGAPGDTPHYPRGVAMAWVLLQLCRLRQPPTAVRLARDRLAAGLRRHRRLDGRLGTRLETALAAQALAAHGEPLDAHILAEALLREAHIDGAFEADPFYRTLVRGTASGPSARAAWWRSRVLTAAWVLGACPDVHLIVGSSSGARTGPIPASP